VSNPSPTPFRFTFTLPLLALGMAFAACNCDPGPIQSVRPEFIANPVALSFETCPTQDENGQPVADVYPDRKTFTLENLGRGAGTLQLTLTGAAKDRFRIIDPPETLGALESTELTVEFTPTAQGDATATLEIDDGDPETELFRVTLVGTGTNLPAQPTLKVSYEIAPGSNEFEECQEGLQCQMYFPDTFYGEASALRVKIRNLGCPALKVQGLDVKRLDIGGGTNVAYFLEQPATPPSPVNPTLLTITDGTQETEAVIRFEPDGDESGNGQRYATFTIKTNSPFTIQGEDNPGERRIFLLGLAAEPAVYATPSFCDFSDENDKCGGTKVTTGGNDKAAIFQVTNGGNVPVLIETVRVVAPNSGRFAFGSQNPQGMTLQPAQSAPLQVLYTDAATYVIDHVEVVATSSGQNAGTARIRVSGGVQPNLTTTPEQELNFSDVAGQSGVKPVQICNGTGAGTLILTQVSVTDGNQFFKLKSGPAANAEVAQGTCVTAEVEFNRPISGGLQAGTLDIRSNDPRYSAGKLITLLSHVPLDQLPVAVAEGPAGQTNSFSQSLAQLTPKRMTIVGSNSYDPPDNGPVAEYEWFIGKKPLGAVASLTASTNTSPTPSIEGVRGNYPTVLLHVDPDKIGEYRIFLKVYDSAGQASSNTSELRILMNP
jgi:hypothetical protein